MGRVVWGTVRTADRAGIPCDFLPTGHMIIRGAIYRPGRAYMGKKMQMRERGQNPGKNRIV